MPVRENRSHWNETSARYQAAHDAQLTAAGEGWGAWSVPESDLNALGDLTGLRVLELGCGAGQWSAVLADDGVDVIGLDLSDQQLKAAREHMRSPYPLVQGAAEYVPFADETFDLVFCDHGGLSWSEPNESIPECSRILKDGGRLVFNVSSPIMSITYDEVSDGWSPKLQSSYFDVGYWEEGDGSRSYSLPYGEWIRVFRRNGFAIEDLIEPRPAPDAATTYYDVEPSDWAHRWPAEALWVVSRDRRAR